MHLDPGKSEEPQIDEPRPSSVHRSSLQLPAVVAAQSVQNIPYSTRSLHCLQCAPFSDICMCALMQATAHGFRYASNHDGWKSVSGDTSIQTSRRLPSGAQHAYKPIALLRCSWSGCQSRVVFKRKYELERHMQKHSTLKPFPCPVVDCVFSGSRAFYRKDKLCAHLRDGHRDEDIGVCPMPPCGMQLPLLILQEHCRRHHT